MLGLGIWPTVQVLSENSEWSGLVHLYKAKRRNTRTGHVNDCRHRCPAHWSVFINQH